MGLIYILLILVGCKKDPIIFNNVIKNSTCEQLPKTPPFGWDYTTRKKNLNVSHSIYDKINPNIIYYLADDTLNNTYILWKLNRITNLKIQLDKNVFGQPQINSKGWLVYYKNDLNLYVIKNNGDSLKQITNSNNYIEPVWDEDENNILTYNNTTNCIIRINKNGQNLDTLFNINSPVFIKDSLMLYFITFTNSQSLVLKNLNNNTSKNIFTNTSPLTYYNFFTDSKNVYYSNSEGLFKTNLITNSVIKILNSCPKELFLHFSTNFITSKLMATKISIKNLNETTLLIQYDLYELDENASNQKMIIIP